MASISLKKHTIKVRGFLIKFRMTEVGDECFKFKLMSQGLNPVISHFY